VAAGSGIVVRIFLPRDSTAPGNAAPTLAPAAPKLGPVGNAPAFVQAPIQSTALGLEGAVRAVATTGVATLGRLTLTWLPRMRPVIGSPART
jgi:hypothetical protein